MNIQPNNHPVSGDSNPIDAPMQKMPRDVLLEIFSNLNDKDKQEVATTQSTWTEITVDQERQRFAANIKDFTQSFSLLLNHLAASLEDDEEVEQVMKIKQEMLDIKGQDILKSVSLVEVKSSAADVKIGLAKLISELPQIQIIGETNINNLIESSPVAEEILLLARVYRFRNEFLPIFLENGDVSTRMIKGLIEHGDLPEAFRIGSLFSETPFYLYEFYDKKIPESTLIQVEKVVDEFPESTFKKDSLLFIGSKYSENGNLEKSLNTLAKVPDDQSLAQRKSEQLLNVAFKFISKGNFGEAEKIVNNLNLSQSMKPEIFTVIEERKNDQAIIKEFSGKGSIEKYENGAILKSIQDLSDEGKKITLFKAVASELSWNKSLDEIYTFTEKLPDSETKVLLINHLESLKYR